MANETQKGGVAEGVGDGATGAEPQEGQSVSGKRPYSPPRVTRLGSVAELTAGPFLTVHEVGGFKKG